MATQSKSALVRFIRSIALLTTVSAVIALSGATAAVAATVTLSVVSARSVPATAGPPPTAAIGKGDPVTAYKYLINVDNTGTTSTRSPTGVCSPNGDARYPANCKWTSIAGVPGSSPIYTQGTQADIAAVTLPAGRYLISVLADGYKLDGKHFTVGAEASVAVTVELQPFPLPDAQIQAAVFEDISPVNGAPDLPAERGLAGFQGHILDYLGEVTTDVYGAPLCGTGVCLSACYIVSGGVDIGTVPPVDAAGRCPLTPPAGSPALAVVEGKIKIPNLGPNRYTLSVTPPNGTDWIQTTTLEGNHDWDAWVMEGATGLDTEFIVAGEPFPAIIFGYVPGPTQTRPPLTGTGTIKGVVDAVKVYVPTVGGVGGLPGQIWGGLAGAKIDKPIPYPWVTLTDLTNGDSLVAVVQGGVNGDFTFSNVPAGNYTLTWWDDKQNYILDLVQVTVGEGETVDMGILPLTGWWTTFEGYVFNDANRNGIKDPGEVGLPGYTLTMRKRENSLMDRGTTLTTTDGTGYYKFEAAYPMTQWLVMEAYDDLHYTTGVTFQADNQPAPTTHLGAGVDVSVHPVIGLGGRLDWGKHTYDATGANGIDPRNGGIVGSLSYDTTRNELDPRYAVAEDWQPGISGLTVNLYAPVSCGTHPGDPLAVPPVPATPCDASGRYELAADGSLAKSALLNNYLSEAWQRPTGCVARNVDGVALAHGTDEQVLPLDPNAECLEAPLMGVQFGTYATDQGTPAANFGATVDGNYGFGDGCFVSVSPLLPGVFDPATGTCTTGSFMTLPGGRDYLVEVAIPNDAMGRPMYNVTREEDINIGNGDTFVPAVPPPACAGPLHTVHVTNPTFLDIGGSPFEGQQKPLCSTKLVTLANGKSVVPMFHLFTEVPIPARMWGLIVDDLNFSVDPKSLSYGEKAGIPFAPVGIYDYTDRLITTVESDFNGLFDVLLPSSNRINCPTPSGVCANLYRFVGNDPGVPGRLNLNYNPQFRTIAAEFEAIPGLLVPADLAPSQVGVSVQVPGGQPTQPVSCRLDDVTPQLFAVSRPIVDTTRSFTITGFGFGAAQGSGAVTLGGVPVTVASWNNTQIAVTAPAGVPVGPQQLNIIAANGQRTVNGLTIHALGTGYSPAVLEVGPGKPYAPAETLPAVADHAIQRALDAAPAGALVVVYPNTPSANPRQNPRGAYYENLIVSKAVKLQGVGPGSPDGSVRGSIIDGGAFAGDSPVATDWAAKIGALTWAGNQIVYDGAVISIYTSATAFPAAFSAATAPSIDGFDLRGGNQQGFPGNINVIGGGATGRPPGLITQGGAIFANGYARNLQITNNVVQNNGGAYGTIRIGTPDLPAPNTSNHNEGVRIASNRVIANAGTNLAGGIGLFNGADNYEVAGNDICGNFSAEYGGGISALGLSPGGRIHHNRIYFNRSYDEGGGVMIAGQLPANTSTLSPGSGPVDIYNNVIQANMALDDGGGIRFLMAGNFPMNVYNNFIVNNVSAHEGGGVSLNDAPDVRVYNNTIMKNLTTATAITSTGAPAPAGLSTSLNSDPLQATLPAGSPQFSNPLLFNNIFWDNRAGTRAGGTVTGLGITGDATPIVNWDLAVADGFGLLSPTNSVLQTNTGTNASATNISSNPNVIATYDTSVSFQVWRNNPAFVGAILVAADLPPNLMGNYHITAASPAYNAGASVKGAVSAPAQDIDDQGRPAFGGFDIGADEVPAGNANLAITITDGLTSVSAGQAVTYTITVSNLGPDAATGATVTDNMPAALTGVTWTCTPTLNCAAASGTGNIATTVSLANGGSATFTVNAMVVAATGSLANTATVAAPAGTTDPTLGNNSATDTDTIVPPTLALLDNFNRANAPDLGPNWSQAPGGDGIRVNGNNAACLAANCNAPARAMWNGPGNVFGSRQGAAFTYISAPETGMWLLLKASGGPPNLRNPANYIRVRWNGNAANPANRVVQVHTTVDGGATDVLRAEFPATFAIGDTLSAVADATGRVYVWKTTGAGVTTFVGSVAIPTSATWPLALATDGGRIGIRLPTGRVDNFRGGTVTP